MPGTCIISGFNDIYAETVDAYPNPASGQVTFNTSGIFMAGALLQIKDVTGRCVHSEIVFADSDHFTTDVSRLADGTYMVQVTEAGRSSSIARFIKSAGR
jgi:hypothetical protein